MTGKDALYGLSTAARRAAVHDRVFGLLVEAALEGRRCPTNEEIGHVLAREGFSNRGTTATVELAREGKLRIDVYRHNYRVVTIADGPHKGAKTTPLPAKKGVSQTPYLTILPGGETCRPAQLQSYAARSR